MASMLLPAVRAVIIAALVVVPAVVAGQPITFTPHPDSRATFVMHAPPETVIGKLRLPRAEVPAGPVSGTVLADPANPRTVTGTITVDLAKLTTDVDTRDRSMRGREYLDIAAADVNRYAVFEIRGVEIAGALDPDTETPAKVIGVLTVKGKPAPTVADARICFKGDTLRVKATFHTTFTSHGMPVPEVLFLKADNDITIETDLILVRH